MSGPFLAKPVAERRDDRFRQSDVSANSERFIHAVDRELRFKRIDSLSHLVIQHQGDVRFIAVEVSTQMSNDQDTDTDGAIVDAIVLIVIRLEVPEIQCQDRTLQ